MRKGMTLRLVIGLLVFCSILLTAVVIIVSAGEVSKRSLSASYLENNYQYAKKLALNTGELLNSMQTIIGSLAAHAGKISTEESQEMLDRSSDMLHVYFNSVFHADETGKILAITPGNSGIAIGNQLTSVASYQAIATKKPMISKPYTGLTGRLIILITHPVFDTAGRYRGFIGGSIYLAERNVLSSLLQEHFYGNGSLVYVVDQQGRLIFHPDVERLGQTVKENEVVDKLREGGSGSQLVINGDGEAFYAGYSYEPRSRWGIISQTPVSVIEHPIRDMICRIILLAIPSFALILATAWYVARRIARPLHQLAHFSETSSMEGDHVAAPPETASAIYEVRQLYRGFRKSSQQLNIHLDDLHTAVKTDGLTGLANRRTFDLALQERVADKVPFALIMLDIDHFKKVNDTYGHLVGDEVLKDLARTMRELSREGDPCFRYGGEEFSILVQYGDKALSWQIAERLREQIAHAPNPTGKPLTISLGIALFPEHATDPKRLITHADEALYQSKASGRNRTTLYQPENSSI